MPSSLPTQRVLPAGLSGGPWKVTACGWSRLRMGTRSGPPWLGRERAAVEPDVGERAVVAPQVRSPCFSARRRYSTCRGSLGPVAFSTVQFSKTSQWALADMLQYRPGWMPNLRHEAT